jgi:hypothetical protein
MVVPTFMRRTYLVLPKPVKRVVRFALPKRDLRVKSAGLSFVDQMDELGNAVFSPMWKWRG